MKTTDVSRWCTVAALAASLSLTTQTVFSHGMGASGWHGGFSHGGSDHHFGSFHNSPDHRFGFRDHFFRNHRRFFVGFDFVGFGFPYWWYPDYYYYGYYGYPYADTNYSPVYDYRYWYGLGAAVQTELARRGYYHGPIDGVLGPASSEAIRAFQRAQGQPVTGLVEPPLLRALNLPAVQRA